MAEAGKLKHKYGRIDFDYAVHLATRPPEEDGPIYMVLAHCAHIESV